MRIKFSNLDQDSEGVIYHGGEPFTGEAIGCYPDGSIAWKADYVDGLQDGWSMSWFPDGQTKAKTKYSRGRVLGESRKWFQDGQLQEVLTINGDGKVVELRRWEGTGTEVSGPLALSVKDGLAYSRLVQSVQPVQSVQSPLSTGESGPKKDE